MSPGWGHRGDNRRRRRWPLCTASGLSEVHRPGDDASRPQRHIPAVIEGVLFDLDDTLIDYSSAARAGLRSLLAALGVKENEEHWLLWPALGAPTLRRVSRRNLLVR